MLDALWGGLGCRYEGERPGLGAFASGGRLGEASQPYQRLANAPPLDHAQIAVGHEAVIRGLLLLRFPGHSPRPGGGAFIWATGQDSEINIKTGRYITRAALMTVTEIAYAVGFSDLKHFCSVFQEHFGVLPGEYARKAPQEEYAKNEPGTTQPRASE